jgi:membrane-associated tyrosine/threonine-specific cdc2-inhibitory kinase
MTEHPTTTSYNEGNTSVTTRNNSRQRENKATIKGLSSSRSPSPFGSSLETPMKIGRKSNDSNAISEAGLFQIKRTRSLDDQRQQHQHQHQLQNNHNHQMSQEDIDMFESNYCEGGSSSCCGDEKGKGTTVATALHSSFDVSLLRGGGEASCSSGDITLFENGPDEDGDSQTIGTRNNTSFDTGDLPSPGKNYNHDSINNYHHHSRPKRAVPGKAMTFIDLKPPATVRKKKQSESLKARRRSGDSATTATTIATSMSYALSPFSMSNTPSRTPGQPLRHANGNDSSSSNARTPVASHTSPAPSSTAKRRRAPFALPARQSPMRRLNTSSHSSSSAISSLLNTPPTPFQTVPPFGAQQATSTKGVGDKNYSLSTQTPTHQNLSSSDPYGPFFKKVPYHTGSTGATHLETTFEADGDSVDTNSPARFRFTSFPASLPRVHHANYYPRSTPPVCPGSVRKRMSFDTEDNGVAENPTNVWKGNDEDDDDNNDPVGLNYSNHQHDAINQSRDDEGTHNTSLSSLSVEGGHHQHLPHLPHQHPAHFASAPSKNLLLFPGEQDADNNRNELNNNLFGYSDDDEDDDLPPTNFGRSDLASPDQGAVRRTRLDFNVFLSPTNIKSSNHHHNSKENEFGGGRRIDLPPNVDLSRPYDSQNRMNSFHSSLSSQTQRNASTHTNEDSLIVGTSSSSLTPPRTVLKNNCNPPKTPREVHLHFPLESECSPILGVPKQDFGDNTTMLDRQQFGNNSAVASSSATTLLGNRFVPKSTISSPSHSTYSATKLRLQQKEEANSSISSSSESSTATQKRRLRPMPDMSAFETVKTSSARTDRTVDNVATAGDLRIMPMPSLIRRERERPCPPTPQRTPAWANEGGSHAFNSLICNKVLLSCPSQVLEGRCSLETSVLDEDSKASGSRRNSFSNSYDRSISAKLEGTKNHVLPREDDDDDDVVMDVDKGGDSVGQSAPVLDTIDKKCKASRVQINAPPKLMRRLPSNPDTNASVSFSGDFEILGSLGSGAFADVYKVRLKSDNQLYAVKRNRRQFRGKRDRDVALAEVQSMQRLQSVFATHNTSGDKKNEDNFKSISSEYNRNCYSLYLLFFYRAWQEDGYFYSQTELCCRDTCREMLDSLRFLWNSAKKKYPSLVKKLPPPSDVQAGSQLDAFGRLVPNMSVWKICHDISAGLSHIHSHGIVHQDIKPSNIFFVTNARFGAMCKIGDFGLAGSIGSSGDGQEGDTRYLPPELLASATRHTSSDIFSLGLTLYEIATDEHIEMPSEGQRWHQLRSSDEPKLPSCRGENLQRLLQSMTDPDERNRPTADTIMNNENVKAAGNEVDTFLQDYIKDVEEYDRREEELLAMSRTEDQTPRNGHRHSTVRSPSLSMLLPPAPNLFSPQAKIVGS